MKKIYTYIQHLKCLNTLPPTDKEFFFIFKTYLRFEAVNFWFTGF